METLEVQFPVLIFSLAAIAGALLHWFKKKTMGEVSGRLRDYVFSHHPGRSGVTGGALAAAIGAVAFGGALDGLSIEQMIMMGFGLGWTFDSALNRGALRIPEGTVSIAPARPAGRDPDAPAPRKRAAKRKSAGGGDLHLIAIMCVTGLVMLVAGCTGGELRKPHGHLEMIEAAEISAQQVQKTIRNLTCMQFEAGTGECTQPGKLDPDDAAEAFEKVARARQGLAAARTIGDGLGECLGEVRTVDGCLVAVNDLLIEADGFIEERKVR